MSEQSKILELVRRFVLVPLRVVSIALSCRVPRLSAVWHPLTDTSTMITSSFLLKYCLSTGQHLLIDF